MRSTWGHRGVYFLLVSLVATTTAGCSALADFLPTLGSTILTEGLEGEWMIALADDAPDERLAFANAACVTFEGGTVSSWLVVCTEESLVALISVDSTAASFTIEVSLAVDGIGAAVTTATLSAQRVSDDQYSGTVSITDEETGEVITGAVVVNRRLGVLPVRRGG